MSSLNKIGIGLSFDQEFRNRRLEERKKIVYPNVWERSPSPPKALLRQQKRIREQKEFKLIF